MDFQTRTVLFLPGIKREDCEEIEDEDELTTIPLETGGMPWISEAGIEYEELPRYFVSFEHWAKSTNLQCLCCSLVIPEMPWFVPLSWTKQPVYIDAQGVVSFEPVERPGSKISPTERDVMRVHSPFCSPLCAKRYLARVRDPKIANAGESLRMLDSLVADFYNLRWPRSDIPEAEDKSLMIQYSGKSGLTPQAFREINEKRLQDFITKNRSD